MNQWNHLEAFLLDGHLEIDNNRSERSIKPFVIGRKNWMFSNTPRGARGSAIMYSVVETAKENNLGPYHYLLYLFEVDENGKYTIIATPKYDDLDNSYFYGDYEAKKIKE